MFEASIKSKSMSFESAKKITNLKPNLPDYYTKINQKMLMKGILCFMLVNQLYMNKIPFAQKFLEKLKLINVDTL